MSVNRKYLSWFYVRLCLKSQCPNVEEYTWQKALRKLAGIFPYTLIAYLLAFRANFEHDRGGAALKYGIDCWAKKILVSLGDLK